MFEKSPLQSHIKPPSKESFLQQADGLRDLARRARRLAPTLMNESDQRRVERYVEELEESATRLEKSAVDAKTG